MDGNGVGDVFGIESNVNDVIRKFADLLLKENLDRLLAVTVFTHARLISKILKLSLRRNVGFVEESISGFTPNGSASRVPCSLNYSGAIQITSNTKGTQKKHVGKIQGFRSHTKTPMSYSKLHTWHV